MIEEILVALAPAIAKLIESAVADDYDQEAEYQALLRMQRTLADLRMKKAFDEAASVPHDGG